MSKQETSVAYDPRDRSGDIFKLLNEKAAVISALRGDDKKGWRVRHKKSEEYSVEGLIGDHPAYPTFFDDKGRFIYEHEGERIDIENDPIEGMVSALKDRVRGGYKLVNESLFLGHEYAFNGHGGEDHVFVVTDRSIKRGIELGFSRRELIITAFASIGHDLGNLVSRTSHPWVFDFMESLLPELDDDPGLKTEVVRAIGLHDERLAKMVMDNVWHYSHDEEGKVDVEEYYEGLVNVFGRPALMLLSSDKSHAVDQDRIPRMSSLENLCEEDECYLAQLDDHYGLASLVRSNQIEVDVGPDEIISRFGLDFSPGHIPEEIANSVGMMSKDGVRRVFVTEEMHRMHREYGIPYSWMFLSSYAEIHGSRWSVKADTEFALTGADEFCIELDDTSDYRNDGGAIIQVALKRGEREKNDALISSLVSQDKENGVPAKVLSAGRERVISFLELLKDDNNEKRFGDWAIRIDDDEGELIFYMTVQITEYNIEHQINYFELLFNSREMRPKK